MKTFADNASRTWTLAVNVDAIKRVKSLLDVNLLDVLDDRCQLLARLAGDDPLLLVDVLYVLCQPAANEQQVTDVEFGRAMAGDAILHGAEALLAELADFFPGEEKRRALRTLLQKLRETERQLVGHAQQKVDALDPVSMAAELIASSGSSLASSA